jgi:TorA maturation chaperone TorD
MNAQPDASHRLMAEDLQALAWLHEHERAPETLVALHSTDFCNDLCLLPTEHPACVDMAHALGALAQQPKPLPMACADDLAVDYAAIYLTHAYRSAPYESVWRDEEHLMMQAPTFDVRAFYNRHGFEVDNWRHMPDDHLSHQLRFTALLLSRGNEREASRFLRTHLMTWLPKFTSRVSARAQTHFYAALAELTHACVQACLTRLPEVAVLPVMRSSAHPGGCEATQR